ncbi:hypothetical protein Gotri_011238 [Gossypium trilobum]|uniref:Uncharacterized protein n=1 Tax=Gossypium trilobum TaxID=34281 RepID=A0A7J9ETM9_9ROSI|nr:hypothetical protein [Gossypium trilobum]
MTVDQLVLYVDEFLQRWLGVEMVHGSQEMPRILGEGGGDCLRQPPGVSSRGDFVRCIFGFIRSKLEPFMVGILAACEALSWLQSWHDANKAAHALVRAALLKANYFDCISCPPYIVGIVNAGFRQW